jgi:hypothetical protein
VQSHACQQAEPRAPYKAGLALEEVRVGVDEFRRPEDLQVADEMTDDEQAERSARDGHHVFFSEGRSPDSINQVHEAKAGGTSGLL